MATSEYIGMKRRAYAKADRAKRMRILDEVCETTGYERKYANRLLTGTGSSASIRAAERHTATMSPRC